MYNISRLQDEMKKQNFGYKIYLGRFDSQEQTIMLTQEIGTTDGNIIGKNMVSLYGTDSITIRVVAKTDYKESIEDLNKIYAWFKNNKQMRQIDIINTTLNQPTLIDKVDDNYKFVFVLTITYLKGEQNE